MLIKNLLAGSTINIRLIIAGILVAVAAAGAFGIRYHINSLKSEIVKLQQEKADLIVDNKVLALNNQTLKQNVGTLEAANMATASTAQSLIAERKSAQVAINNLAAASLKDKQDLAAARATLDDMSKNPANDGEVSPILKEAIRAIQDARGTK